MEEQRKGGKEDSAEIHFARCLVMRIEGDLKRHTKQNTSSLLCQFFHRHRKHCPLLRSPFVNCCSSLNPSFLIPITLLSFVSLPDPLISLSSPPPLSLTITPSTFSYPSPSVHPSLSTSQLTSLSLLFPSLTSLSLLFSSSLSP